MEWCCPPSYIAYGRKEYMWQKGKQLLLRCLLAFYFDGRVAWNVTLKTSHRVNTAYAVGRNLSLMAWCISVLININIAKGGKLSLANLERVTALCARRLKTVEGVFYTPWRNLWRQACSTSGDHPGKTAKQTLDLLWQYLPFKLKQWDKVILCSRTKM